MKFFKHFVIFLILLNSYNNIQILKNSEDNFRIRKNQNMKCQDNSEEFAFNFPLNLVEYDDEAVEMIKEKIVFNNFLDNTNVELHKNKFELIDTCLQKAKNKNDFKFLKFNSISLNEFFFKPVEFRIMTNYNKIADDVPDLEIVFLLRTNQQILRFSIFFKVDDENSKSVSDSLFESLINKKEKDVFTSSTLTSYLNDDSNLLLYKFSLNEVNNFCDKKWNWLVNYDAFPISRIYLDKLKNLSYKNNQKVELNNFIKKVKVYKNHLTYDDKLTNVYQRRLPNYLKNLDDTIDYIYHFHMNNLVNRISTENKIIKVECPLEDVEKVKIIIKDNIKPKNSSSTPVNIKNNFNDKVLNKLPIVVNTTLISNETEDDSQYEDEVLDNNTLLIIKNVTKPILNLFDNKNSKPINNIIKPKQNVILNNTQVNTTSNETEEYEYEEIYEEEKNVTNENNTKLNKSIENKIKNAIVNKNEKNKNNVEKFTTPNATKINKTSSNTANKNHVLNPVLNNVINSFKNDKVVLKNEKVVKNDKVVVKNEKLVKNDKVVVKNEKLVKNDKLLKTDSIIPKQNLENKNNLKSNSPTPTTSNNILKSSQPLANNIEDESANEDEINNENTTDNIPTSSLPNSSLSLPNSSSPPSNLNSSNLKNQMNGNVINIKNSNVIFTNPDINNNSNYSLQFPQLKDQNKEQNTQIPNRSTFLKNNKFYNSNLDSGNINNISQEALNNSTNLNFLPKMKKTQKMEIISENGLLMEETLIIGE